MFASTSFTVNFAFLCFDRYDNYIRLLIRKTFKMLAIEDFPEYQVPGAKQVQFNPYESNGG